MPVRLLDFLDFFLTKAPSWSQTLEGSLPASIWWLSLDPWGLAGNSPKDLNVPLPCGATTCRDRHWGGVHCKQAKAGT